MEYFDIKQLRRRQGLPGRERKFPDGGADRRRHEQFHDRGRIDDPQAAQLAAVISSGVASTRIRVATSSTEGACAASL